MHFSMKSAGNTAVSQTHLQEEEAGGGGGVVVHVNAQEDHRGDDHHG